MTSIGSGRVGGQDRRDRRGRGVPGIASIARASASVVVAVLAVGCSSAGETPAATAQTAKLHGSGSRDHGDGNVLRYRLDGLSDHRRGSWQINTTSSGAPGGSVTRHVEGRTYQQLAGQPSWFAPPAAAAALQAATPNIADPWGLLKQMNEYGSVRRIGSVTVKGVTTTHSRWTRDTRRSLARIPAKYRMLFDPAHQSRDTADVWTDRNGVAVRITTRSEGGDGTSTETVDYTDFGTPVRITPPPPSQIESTPNPAQLRP